MCAFNKHDCSLFCFFYLTRRVRALADCWLDRNSPSDHSNIPAESPLSAGQGSRCTSCDFRWPALSLALRVATRIWTRACGRRFYARMLLSYQLWCDAGLKKNKHDPVCRALEENVCLSCFGLATLRFSPSPHMSGFLISYRTCGGSGIDGYPRYVIYSWALTQESSESRFCRARFGLSVLVHEGILTGQTRFS